MVGPWNYRVLTYLFSGIGLVSEESVIIKTGQSPSGLGSGMQWTHPLSPDRPMGPNVPPLLTPKKQALLAFRRES